MARPIAGINEYPYGVCGYIANGVHFHDHTKTTNLRIYKQRSDVMFDLIDPSTEIVYQKLLLTGVDVTGVFLDYSLSDSQLVNMIPRNTFFVRGYNPQHTIEGFVIRFLTNKKILSNGKVLYDMYIPECGIPPIDISNIIANPIKNGDTSITGVITVPSGTVNTNGMVITATLPDGREVTGIVNPDGSFVIDTVTPIVGPGTVTIKVTSPNYNDKSVTVPIIMDDQDSDYVTSISIPSSEQQQSGNVFVSTIPASVHGRGNDIVIQLQSLDQTNFVLYDADVSVVNGNITVTKYDDTPYRVVIIGKTLKTTPYVAPLAWTASGEKFLMNIAASEHGKKNISFTVYEGNRVVMLEVDLESDEEIILHSNIELTGKIVIVGKD
ncbi:carboxypeptidase-like regulatory domain-containing protein [Salmonella enterica]|uniref:carboxypeptidase-like regulatory domain-containing protein n=1 Tax=Salmonella enterica TaxID=28901 RepID=UPI003A80675E